MESAITNHLSHSSDVMVNYGTSISYQELKPLKYNIKGGADALNADREWMELIYGNTQKRAALKLKFSSDGLLTGNIFINLGTESEMETYLWKGMREQLGGVIEPLAA